MRIFYRHYLVELDGYDLCEGSFDAVVQVGISLLEDVDVSVSFAPKEGMWSATVGGVAGGRRYSPDAAIEEALRAYCAQHVKERLSELPVLDDFFLQNLHCFRFEASKNPK